MKGLYLNLHIQEIGAFTIVFSVIYVCMIFGVIFFVKMMDSIIKNKSDLKISLKGLYVLLILPIVLNICNLLKSQGVIEPSPLLSTISMGLMGLMIIVTASIMLVKLTNATNEVFKKKEL